MLVFRDQSANEKLLSLELGPTCLITPFTVETAPGDSRKYATEIPFGFVVDPLGSGPKDRRLFYFDAGDPQTLSLWINTLSQAQIKARSQATRKLEMADAEDNENKEARDGYPDDLRAEIDEAEKQRVHQMFKKYDRNGDGTLDLSELRLICLELGASVTADDLDRAMEKLDTNKDGSCDFDEFLKFWTSTPGAGGYSSGVLQALQAKVAAQKAFSKVVDYETMEDLAAAKIVPGLFNVEISPVLPEDSGAPPQGATCNVSLESLDKVHNPKAPVVLFSAKSEEAAKQFCDAWESMAANFTPPSNSPDQKALVKSKAKPKEGPKGWLVEFTLPNVDWIPQIPGEFQGCLESAILSLSTGCEFPDLLETPEQNLALLLAGVRCKVMLGIPKMARFLPGQDPRKMSTMTLAELCNKDSDEHWQQQVESSLKHPAFFERFLTQKFLPQILNVASGLDVHVRVAYHENADMDAFLENLHTPFLRLSTWRAFNKVSELEKGAKVIPFVEEVIRPLLAKQLLAGVESVLLPVYQDAAPVHQEPKEANKVVKLAFEKFNPFPILHYLFVPPNEEAGIEIGDAEKDALQETFKKFDTDGSGQIEESELAALIEQLGGDAEQCDIKDAVVQLDTDADGAISFDEFLQLFSSKPDKYGGFALQFLRAKLALQRTLNIGKSWLKRAVGAPDQELSTKFEIQLSPSEFEPRMSAEATLSVDGTSSLPPSACLRLQAKSPEAAEEFVAFSNEAKEKATEPPEEKPAKALLAAMMPIAEAQAIGLELSFEAEGDLVIIKGNEKEGENQSKPILNMIQSHIPETANLGTVILKAACGFSFDDFLAGELKDGMKLSGEATISTAACAAAAKNMNPYLAATLQKFIDVIAGADFRLTVQHDKLPSAKTAAMYKTELSRMLARMLSGDEPGLDTVISEKLTGAHSLEVIGGPSSLHVKFENFNIFSLLSLKQEGLKEKQ